MPMTTLDWHVKQANVYAKRHTPIVGVDHNDWLKRKPASKRAVQPVCNCDGVALIQKRTSTENEFCREWIVLAHTHGCAHLVQLVAVDMRAQRFYLETLHMDLARFFRRRRFKRLSFDWRLRLAIDVVCGLHQLHTTGFLHCDLKPENVLVYQDRYTQVWRAKLCDFGLCMPVYRRGDSTPLLPVPTNQYVYGNMLHKAPENMIWRQDNGKLVSYDVQRALHTATDVYGCGIVLWALCVGKDYDPPDQYDERSKYMDYVLRLRGRPSLHTLEKAVPQLGTSLANLLTRCWAHKPSERITLPALLFSLQHLYRRAVRIYLAPVSRFVR